MSRPVNAANVKAAIELCMMVSDWFCTDHGNEVHPLGQYAPPTHSHPTAMSLAARTIERVAEITGHYSAETAAEAASWIASGWRFAGDEFEFTGPNAPPFLHNGKGEPIGFALQVSEVVEADAEIADEFDVSDVEAADDEPAEPNTDTPPVTDEQPFTPEVFDFNPDGTGGEVG